mgnify:CR=1 FL=1
MSEDLDDIRKLLEKKASEEENVIKDSPSGDIEKQEENNVVEEIVVVEHENDERNDDVIESEHSMGVSDENEVIEDGYKTVLANSKDVYDTESTSVEEEPKNEKPSPAKRGRKPKQQKQENNIEVAKEEDVINYTLIDGYYHQQLDVGVLKLYPDVILPEYKHLGDACMDLRAHNIIWIKNEMGVKLKVPENFESITIYQGYTVKFGTGFKIDLPKGWAADIKIRSGVSSEEAIILMNGEGKVDNPYTGEWCFCIGKINKCPFTINKNDRLMQFELRPQIKCNLIEINEIKVDKNNERGDGGFGHSGLQ